MGFVEESFVISNLVAKKLQVAFSVLFIEVKLVLSVVKRRMGRMRERGLRRSVEDVPLMHLTRSSCFSCSFRVQARALLAGIHSSSVS